MQDPRNSHIKVTLKRGLTQGGALARCPLYPDQIDFLTRYLTPRVLEAVDNVEYREYHAKVTDPDMEFLTRREYETLVYIVWGYSVKESASDLGIGYDTVRTHRSRVYKKLRVGSAVEAIVKAHTLGYIDIDKINMRRPVKDS